MGSKPEPELGLRTAGQPLQGQAARSSGTTAAAKGRRSRARFASFL